MDGLQRRRTRTSWALLVVLVLLGLLWMLAFPLTTITTWEPKQRETYISENSLQPMSAGISFSADDMAWVARFDREYVMAREKLERRRGQAARRESIALWVQARMVGLGADTGHTAGRTADTYLSHTPDGIVVYGVWRAAPCRVRKESVFVAVPYLGDSSFSSACASGFTANLCLNRRAPESTTWTVSSLSLGMGVVRMLQKQQWSSKDIVLLVVDNSAKGTIGHFRRTGRVAMRAWLRQYHGSRLFTPEGEWPPRGPGSAVQFHAGIIRGALAVNVDEPASGTCAGDGGMAGLALAGTYGRLPNLDLVNVAVRVARHPSMGPTTVPRVTVRDGRGFGSQWSVGAVRRLRTWLGGSTLPRRMFSAFATLPWCRQYVDSVAALTKFASALGSNIPKMHGSFLEFNVDSATLSSDMCGGGIREEDGRAQHDSTPSDRHSHDFLAGTPAINRYRLQYAFIAKMVEGTFRSLSNLDEHLHQSFYLYLLSSPVHMVTIGEYAPPLVLLTLPLLFIARFRVGTPLDHPRTGSAAANRLKWVAVCRNARYHRRVAAALATVACVCVGAIFASLRLRVFAFVSLLVVLPWAEARTVLSGSQASMFPGQWHIYTKAQTSIFVSSKMTSKRGNKSNVRPMWASLVCTALFCFHGIAGILVYPYAVRWALVSSACVSAAIVPNTSAQRHISKLVVAFCVLFGASGLIGTMTESRCSVCSTIVRHHHP